MRPLTKKMMEALAFSFFGVVGAGVWQVTDAPEIVIHPNTVNALLARGLATPQTVVWPGGVVAKLALTPKGFLLIDRASEYLETQSICNYRAFHFEACLWQVATGELPETASGLLRFFNQTITEMTE